MTILTGVILLAIGLIACFFGKKFYRIVLALFGFTAGYYSMSGVLATQPDMIQIVGSVVAGLIVGFLFWTFYKFAYVLFGAFVGLAIGTIIGITFNLSSAIFAVVAILGLIIGAIIGSRVATLIIEFSTAFGGATQAIV
jgi:hypothetical protein